MCFVVLPSLLVIDLLAASVVLQCWVYKGNVVSSIKKSHIFLIHRLSYYASAGQLIFNVN